jgi:hypothetical protein
VTGPLDDLVVYTKPDSPTPVYDDTCAWQRERESMRLYQALSANQWIYSVPALVTTGSSGTATVTINADTTRYETGVRAASEAIQEYRLSPPKKEIRMSKRDVQFLFWSMIIAGFFGVMLALALNGWFD